MTKQTTEVTDSQIAAIRRGFDILEQYLVETKYVAGENVTIADFSLIATVTSLMLFLPITPKQYPKISVWLDTVSKMPCYVANDVGVKKFYKFFKGLMGN